MSENSIDAVIPGSGDPERSEDKIRSHSLGQPASGFPFAASSPSRRVYGSVLRWLVRLSRFGLVALFLFTAGAKIAIAKAFATNVSQLLSASGFNYERWMWPTTIAVIIAEAITAVLLLVPRTVRIGAVCAAALLIGFAGYALYYVYVLNGEPLECGCFGGIIGSQLGVSTALRNLGLLVPALVVFFGYKRTATAAQLQADQRRSTK